MASWGCSLVSSVYRLETEVYTVGSRGSSSVRLENNWVRLGNSLERLGYS